jgi:signal transduction histidine kinase
VRVVANCRRLLQVLTNLLANAVKYNRPGGRVELRCAPADNGMQRIEVKDSGSGITAKEQNMLFRPYRRLGDKRADGTGLGLVISREFMELMGGRLGLAQSSSAGSTFFIELAGTLPAGLRPAA